MAKIRVYELAREMKIESKALMTKLISLGIEVQSHQSTLTQEQIQRLKASEGAESKPKVVLRRKKKSDEADAGAEGADESAVTTAATPLRSSVSSDTRSDDAGDGPVSHDEI